VRHASGQELAFRGVEDLVAGDFRVSFGSADHVRQGQSSDEK
jgi:hypothetical protein